MKWFGHIGFEIQDLVEPGVYEPRIIDKPYYGDVERNYKTDKSSQSINNQYTLNNSISVICDPFLTENFHTIVYVTFMNAKWRPSSVEVQYPRLIIYMGDVYREEGGE